ncbi:hypothetical protein E6O75_ATG04859 [Venturia nashicola]|uniref:Major facilitator superfamily (MFS) profile domain-containing protein n=1 Tax=Venturia nashicola TaxID=86259 RepID=A0A4Z1P4J3_9PEZI|nr:hypothetical protein E6O75_ATG04859 [Venturia nashicola]
MGYPTLRGARLTTTLGLLGAIAFTLQGYDQGLMNGLITLPTFYTQFPETNAITTSGSVKSRASTVQGTTVAIYEVGAAIGAGSCYFLGDRLGRRRMISLAAGVVLVGVVVQSSAFALAQLIVGRVVTGMFLPRVFCDEEETSYEVMVCLMNVVGLGVGAFTATIPMWVAECTRAHSRGSLVSKYSFSPPTLRQRVYDTTVLENAGAIGGLVFVSWFEFGLYFVKNNSVNWRLPIAFQALFALAVLIGIWGLPESPRWLVLRDRTDQARTTLSALDDVPLDDELVATDLSQIQHSLSLENVGESTNPFAPTKNRHLQRTVTAIAVNMFCQMSGVNVISFYSNSIFEGTLGYTAETSRIISGCLQIWQFIWACTAVFLIDRFGRRQLLLAGAAGMALSQAGLAGLTSHLENRTAASLSLLFDFIALGIFPVCLFVIAFMYSAEIAPLRIRAKVTAMSTATNWLFNFLLAEITPVGFASIKWRYYLVYVCTNCAAFLFFYLFCPETKGRSLEGIDEIYVRSENMFMPVRVAREMPVEDSGGNGDLAFSAEEKKEQEFEETEEV